MIDVLVQFSLRPYLNFPCVVSHKFISTINLTYTLTSIRFNFTPLQDHITVVRNNVLHTAAELGSNPVSKHQIQPEYGDEQADAGRDG